MSSQGRKMFNDVDEEKQEQQQQDPLIPPPRAARTYFIPITSASVEMRQDWLERLNMFFTLCGAAFIIVGACSIVLPLFFSITVQTLTRWILVAGGVVALLHFLLIFGAPATTSFLLLGILHLGVGLWMVIMSSVRQYSPFFYIMAGWFIVHGIIKFLMACQLRNLTSWPALLVSGVASILLAAAHFVFTYDLGLTFFSVLFGADLAFTGFSFFLIAFMACLASRASSTQEPLLEEASYHAAHARSP
ncbi:hypothetical protein GOP47_0005320 [Adiantum capillus-veneris]|uniref:Uncharacterized protein n=1 Tax=Adiantum capillus-veneris TaxID=13818 RepID=A0A9D4ZNG9_ADICA|nr:hypothetical protein GOP47_0005320 [Adiantum capillus-veneris]